MTITKTIFALATLVATNFAHAQNASQSAQVNLHLSGKVSIDCSIQVAATNIASNLTLRNGETNAVDGIVTENCNAGDGYTVSITSKNGGILRGGKQNIGYTASYDDGVGAISNEIVAKRNAAHFDRKGNFSISIPAMQVEAGTYNDMITFVIAAK